MTTFLETGTGTDRIKYHSVTLHTAEGCEVYAFCSPQTGDIMLDVEEAEPITDPTWKRIRAAMLPCAVSSLTSDEAETFGRALIEMARLNRQGPPDNVVPLRR